MPSPFKRRSLRQALLRLVQHFHWWWRGSYQEASLFHVVAVSSLVFLALLGGIAARAGGAPITVGAIRVTFWGAIAMALTAGVGRIFGVVA